MVARSPVLAKLTRPKLYDALPRPRLFSLLDNALAKPIVWLCAPPGAGKTTLVASYLQARKLRDLWYQIDVGDADAPTFVHYMRNAAIQLAGNAAAPLPLLTPELQGDLARFSRIFFRDLFTALPRSCTLVFDNFHEAKTDPQQRAAFAQGLEEVPPEGISIIMLSRGNPPPEFARLIASGRVARIDGDALRCTEQEAAGILGQQDIGREVLERINRQSEGWVAALVLMREHLSRAGANLEQSLGEGKEAIFQYFAGEIFNGARPESQRILMLTAIPPSITEHEAVTLTSSEDAPRVLEYLYQRHLFIDRRRDAHATYNYHALFREFLLTEVARRLPVDQRRAVQARAAELLAQRGQVSDALTLFRDARQWEAMRRLIHANALEWARQGRAQALSDWIAALPSDARQNDPWLEYWLGRAWIFVQPQRGRPALVRAFEAFRTAGDLKGQALALNTLVAGCYYEWVDFTALDRWLPELERVLGTPGNELDAGSALRAHAAYLIALLFRNPDEDRLAQCAQSLDQLIDGEPDLNVRIMAASTLFNYYNWITKGSLADGLVARIEPFIGEPEVTPLMQIWWRTHIAYWHYLHVRYDEALSVIAVARAIAERYGLDRYAFEIDRAETATLIAKGETAAARARIEAMERRLSAARPMDFAYFYHLRSSFGQRTGRVEASLDDAERAVRIARETGIPAPQLPHFLTRLAHASLAAGNIELGLRALDEAVAAAPRSEQAHMKETREIARIGVALEGHKTEEVVHRLAAVLGERRRRGQLVFLRNRPELAATLASIALEHGIEAAFVQRLIERNRLAPPPGAAPVWPYRLRVRALGTFELLRDGEPMRFSGKAQQRPLDLMKAVVALGGINIDVQQLMAILWPDADGAAAKTSFESTLFRLRKLLDIDQVLLLTASKLSLNRTIAWTDVWALNTALEDAEHSAERKPTARAAQDVLSAYAGPLLASEDSAWTVQPRDALRARFVRTLVRLGETLERERDWAAAADLYRRGLETDNLAEAFYRGLMRSLAAVGEDAEALNVFRRCRELLSIVLGVKPSAATERLHRQITSGQHPV